MTTSAKAGLAPAIRSLRLPSFKLRFSALELVAAGAVVLVFTFAAFYYARAFKPVRARLTLVENEYKEQQRVLLDASRGGSASVKDKIEEIKKAQDSLQSFEAGSLKSMVDGRITMIDEINHLASANRLRLAGGIEMRKVNGHTTDQDLTKVRHKDQQDDLDIYPRVEFRFNVDGDYQDLRKFIRDIEASKQFVVIQGLNLNYAEQKPGRGSRVASRGVSGIVLSVTMDAYFSAQ